MSVKQKKRIVRRMVETSNWRIVKDCQCVGASKPAFPLPICAVCGKPWRFEWQ